MSQKTLRRNKLESILRASTPIMLEGWSPTPGADPKRARLLGTSSKGKFNDLVTVFDTRMEAYITERLRKAFPGDTVLGEESFSSAKQKGRAPDLRRYEAFWIIDPIDGTVNYSRGYPYFCATAAYLTRDKKGRFEAQVGATWNPLSGEMFVAARGEGAWLNRRRLKMTQVKKPEQCLVCTGFAHVREGKLDARMMNAVARIIGKTLGIRRDGSAALDFAYLAAGRFDAFIEKGLAPWDTAAGILLVEEAGGRVTNFSGKWMDPVGAGQEILATNGFMHSWVQKQLATR